MHYNKQDIDDWDRIFRLKIINSVTGIKPANLIGTCASDGSTNLAIFSSVVHLGSRPALLGIITRPSTEDVGHTLQNIVKVGEYTINHIHPELRNRHIIPQLNLKRLFLNLMSVGLRQNTLITFRHLL